ncbi:nitroreductase/quinone reductase family protein [Gordonia aichiensis]
MSGGTVSARILSIRNRAATTLYRSSRGRIGGRAVGHPVLLLTVRGRRSGVLRTTPLLYLTDLDSLIVVGSGFGASSDPEWCRNLAVSSTATVQIGRYSRQVRPEAVSGDDLDRIWRDVLDRELPELSIHQERSGRQFPVFRLIHPV